MVLETALISYGFIMCGINIIRIEKIKRKARVTMERIYVYKLWQLIHNKKVEVDYTDVQFPSFFDISNWGNKLLTQEKENILNKAFTERRI